ncbi:MAG: hypothetical protein D6711_00855, partial [Chloroflexi bacterium]
MIKRYLSIITVAYWIVAGLYAVRVPEWQTPDEPAHYHYIAQIAQTGQIPVIEAGDWDQAYLDALKGSRFDASLMDDFETIQYEDHQPPLYYALAAPIYSLTDGSLTALRLFSVLIGTLIIWSALGVGLLMFPKRPWIGLGAAAFVAFQPMHVHILASVNNDALGWAMVGVLLVGTIAYVKKTPLFGREVKAWHLGVLMGLAFITKATTYFMAGVIPLAILLHWWADDTRKPSDLIKRWGAFLLPALVFGLAWWVRNFDVYGFPDFMGLAAHDAVVVGQPRTADLIDRLGFGGYVREISSVTFNSFWGRWGWMALPMERRWELLIFGGLIIAFVGVIIDTIRRTDKPTPPQRNAWIILGAVTLLSVLAYLYYNSEFQQHQGRYMFTLLIPLGVWLALGVDAWRRLIPRLSPLVVPG